MPKEKYVPRMKEIHTNERRDRYYLFYGRHILLYQMSEKKIWEILDNFPFGRGDATKQVARFAMDKKRRYEVVT